MSAGYLTPPKRAFIAALSSCDTDDPSVMTAFLTDRLLVSHKKKNTLLWSSEATSNPLYFVYVGLVRGYCAEDEKEITTWLAKENDFINGPRRFPSRQPVSEQAECLEDTVVVSLTYQDLKDLDEISPTARWLGHWPAEGRWRQSEEQLRLLRSLGAEARLRKWLADHPELYGRVQHRHLASYLGMSKETLSRMLNKKN